MSQWCILLTCCGQSRRTYCRSCVVSILLCLGVGKTQFCNALRRKLNEHTRTKPKSKQTLIFRTCRNWSIAEARTLNLKWVVLWGDLRAKSLTVW